MSTEKNNQITSEDIDFNISDISTAESDRNDKPSELPKKKTKKKSLELQKSVEDNLTNPDLLKIKERLLILDDKKKKVAKMIGITDVYLSYILNGKRRLTTNVKSKLFDYLGLG